MTKHDAVKHLSHKISYAQEREEPWADCVYVDALETAVRAIAKVNRFEQWLNERGDNEEFSASYIRKKWEEWDDE